ncbi:sensor histidine kinase KdpD [Alcaligenes aquatilis]|uniref:histidine kinase n=1 Tax=Alcaligenes aquatilis TaxID=323284 RepID=A0ABY4NL63_9BURK|nr:MULTISPECIES: sensor histidine kinase KdpD [Alcaligenes]UQN37386.1 sensor histidine kinase KdpD [Alcaligenes aquatilis]HBQ89813.1 sensor histidine kinase KdpD [Alcaligenes faecalis]
MSPEDRPDPDTLLQVIGEDPHQPRRGQLKIFFGACAGVGKTYAMLKEAHQRQSEGVSVAIGIVETHGRQETQALIDGLPVLARKAYQRQGRVVTEFDLDAALASGYQLLLVDELAHSNLEGSRHAKRWQDVEELLDAGIDVYTALNVQHLDSLNEVVGGIVGVRVRETVPDRIFDRAADVLLVDLPPDDLLSRLNAGKVYLADSVAHARQNFFRRGNLIALRELALRRVADRVNADVHVYRISHAIRTVWPTRELLMVCVSADSAQEALIREGARLAQQLQTPWIVLHVDTPQESGQIKAQEALVRLAASAQHAGAEFANIAGQDVAHTILAYARQRNVTKLILGNSSARSVWPWRTSLSERLARSNPEIGLLLLRMDTVQRPIRPLELERPMAQGKALSIASIICVATTLLAEQLLSFFDLSNVIMLFLITVVFIALRLGRLAGAWASLLSVAFFDFFFVAPRYSFSVTDTQYVFTFGVMLVVTLIIGQLAAKLQAEARAARDGERRAAALTRVSRDLAGALALEQVLAVCRDTLEPLFEMQLVLVVPDQQNQLVATRHTGFVELSVAQWVFDHMEAAGNGTETLNGASALYLPLKGPMAPRGVLVVQSGAAASLSTPDGRRLLDACCFTLAQALERIHYVEIAQDTVLRMEGEKMRNTLLSAVSHDLRTPLTVIRGLAETLEQPKGLSEAERTDIAHSIRIESDELRRQVSNLLDLARMQSEGVKLHKEWHALGEIVGIAVARCAAALQPRKIVTEFATDLPLVEVDGVLLERVVTNLLDNAAKYTPATSTISLRGLCSGQSMYLLISDDGPGLPPGDPERLFETFTRGYKESSVAGVGLGLGLCRTIIAAHGGTISAKPRQPHGVIFEISLPWKAAPQMDGDELLT